MIRSTIPIGAQLIDAYFDVVGPVADGVAIGATVVEAGWGATVTIVAETQPSEPTFNDPPV